MGLLVGCWHTAGYYNRVRTWHGDEQHFNVLLSRCTLWSFVTGSTGGCDMCWGSSGFYLFRSMLSPPAWNSKNERTYVNDNCSVSGAQCRGDLSLPEVEGTKPPGSNVTPFGTSTTDRPLARAPNAAPRRTSGSHPSPRREMLCELHVTPAILPDSARFGEEASARSGTQTG